MKIINLILFSFCILLQGCKNEPKEQLENKMYLIPIISNDSILVFGKTNISGSQLPHFKKVFEINEKKIIAVELLIEEKFLNYCKLKNMYLYNELKNVNFDQLRRQYLFFEDTKGSKNIIVRLWNPNFNNASKEYFNNCYLKPYTNRIFSNGRLYVYSITVDFDKMEIIDYWYW